MFVISNAVKGEKAGSNGGGGSLNTLDLTHHTRTSKEHSKLSQAPARCQDLPSGEQEKEAIDQVLPLVVTPAPFDVQLLQAGWIASDQWPAKNQQLLLLQLVLCKRHGVFCFPSD